MSLIGRLQNLNWRLIGAALVAVGVVHICATLAAPMLFGANSAYRLLAARLPPNKLFILPAVSSAIQPLPFMSDDVRYAVCRIDTANGPVGVEIVLPDRGWTASLYSETGETLYVASGQMGRSLILFFEVISSEERFTGPPLQAKSTSLSKQPPVVLNARKGLLIVRAPERGFAYQASVEADLARTRCGVRSPA